MTTNAQAVSKTSAQNVSQTSNWPYIQKAAFWKEDNTVMKIVKFITSAIILPLAFLMDLANKAHNYIWPINEEVQVQETVAKPISFLAKVKNTVVDFMKNHPYITGGAGIAVLGAGAYLGRNLPCNIIGVFCPKTNN